jgi:sugar lactone lactonase YvrE
MFDDARVLALRHLTPCLILGVAACAGPAEFVWRTAEPIAWPSVADQRVVLEFGYHDTEDVERHHGFWAGLSEFFLGSARRELVAPRGLAWSGDDVLWIADAGSGAVHRLSLSSGEHTVLEGSEEEPFESPIGVAAHPDGRVFVTDSARSRVVTLADDGSVLAGFGDAEELGRPTGIAYDARLDRLLVVDTVGCRVLALAPPILFHHQR